MAQKTLERSTGDTFPQPDPTRLTTDQLMTAIAALKELLRSEQAAIKELVLMKIAEQRENVNIAILNTERLLNQGIQEVVEDSKHHAADDILQHDRLRVDSKAALETAVNNLRENIVTALASSKEAIYKSEATNMKSLDTMMGDIRALTLRQGELITRPEHAGLAVRIQDLTNRINMGEGRSTGVHDGWKYFLGALGGVASLAGIGGVILALINFLHIAGK